MFRKWVVLIWVLLGLARGAAAQDQDLLFVQIEAKRSLVEATDAARAYAARLPDVNGFALGRGWYGIALGPYLRADAEQVLRVYRSEGVIPRDSFLARPRQFAGQFWPVGANILGRGSLAPSLPQAEIPVAEAPVAVPEPAPEPEPAPATQPADETPRQARASEGRLTADERKALQVALKWAGTYRGQIDGAYGRGTRTAMSQWQRLNNFEQTGILTTRQRTELLRQYNAVLDGLDLAEVVDDVAGVSMIMPTAAVRFQRHTSPFAQYDATGLVPEARVLLISQPGTQETLFGLYEILQTLEMVPLDGPRERTGSGFRIKGEDSRIVSETRVSLRDNQIKGFTFVWPAGDEERRTRIMAQMEQSFARLEGVLPLELVLDSAEPVDLLEGIEVRKPRLSRSGFFVDSQGSVVTTSAAVAGCARLTLDTETEADLVFESPERGIAVLRPKETLAPQSVARFSAALPRRQSEVAVAGYSFEGVLGAPTLTFGRLSDLRGLNGEAELRRLALAALPGDAGGPVLDAGGGVVGMLLPRQSGPRSLPEEVNFATGTDAIQAALDAAGLAGAETDSSRPIDPIDLTAAAQGMTVLVSCWD